MVHSLRSGAALSVGLLLSVPAWADSQINSGTITNTSAPPFAPVTNCDGAGGLCGLVSRDSPIDLTNKGRIDLEQGGAGRVFGLYAVLDNPGEDATLQNFGFIGVRAATGTSRGLSADLGQGGDAVLLYNFGTIRSEAAGGADTYGLMVVGAPGADVTASLVNSGTTVATASGTGDSYGLSSAIRGKNSTVNLVNLGTISSSVQGSGTAYGLNAELYDRGDVGHLSNTGTVIAQAAPGGAAYGLAVVVGDADSQVVVNNIGRILVQGDTAHQLRVSGVFGIGGIAHVGVWNLELRDYAAVADNQKPFAVADHATLHFGDGSGGGTDLIVYPAGRRFIAGQPYAVADMVSTDGTGRISGHIDTVSTPLPFLTAHLSGGDYSDQTIALTVNAEESDGQTAEVGQVMTMQDMVGRVGLILAVSGDDHTGSSGVSSGDDVSAAGLQVRPYYAHQSRRGSAASDLDSAGVLIFGNRTTENGHSIGVHGGIEHTTLQAASRTLKMNTMAGLLGVQGRYNMTEGLYVRGQVSGMMTHNQHHFTTADGADSATDTGVGYGVYAAVYGGYDVKLGDGHILTPEIGVGGLWSHVPTIHANYENNPALNQSYKPEDYFGVYGHASVRWTGAVPLGDLVVKPILMGGVRQTLNDGKINSVMTFGGDQFRSSVSDRQTVGLVQAGVTVPVGAMTDVALTYGGEYGQKTTSHMGYLNLKVTF